MVSNTQIGRSFAGVVLYQFTGRRDQPVDKKAEILGFRGVRTSSATEMIADFETGRLANPRLGNAVWHVSLSFNPTDASRLDSAQMLAIAEGYLEKMKLDKTQYVIVRHHDTPGNQHLHIIANRVDDEGKTIADGRNFYRSKEALRELIQEHGLTPPDKLRSEKQHPEKLQGSEATRYELRQALAQILTTATQLAEVEAALQAKGIEVRYHRNKAGEPTGISFAKAGVAFKGSALARHYSLTGIQKQLATTLHQQTQPVSEKYIWGTLVEARAEPAASVGEQPPVPRFASTAQATSMRTQEVESALPSLLTQVPANKEATNEPTTKLLLSSNPAEAPAILPAVSSKTAPAVDPIVTATPPLRIAEPGPVSVAIPAVEPQVLAQPPMVLPEASAVEAVADYWTRFDRELADWQAGRTLEAQQEAWDEAWLAHSERVEEAQQAVAQAAQVSRVTGASLPQLLAMKGLELVSEADEVRVRHRASSDLFTTEEVLLPVAALAASPQAYVQYGCIELGALDGKSAGERLELCRSFLEKTGMIIGQVEPITVGGLARLDYCFHVQQADLAEVAQCLNSLQKRENTHVYEAPHPLHNPTASAFGLAVPRQQWLEREGQFNQAQFVLAGVGPTQQTQAIRISQALQQDGVAVSAITQNGLGHLELAGTYHTYHAEIGHLNATLDGAGQIPGVALREPIQALAARRQGAVAREQTSRSPTFEIVR
jgi:hypothetical protein